MSYKIIDINLWSRKEYFNHFTKDIPCTYSITCNIDVTNILNKGCKFYPSCIYAITKTVNMYDEFKTAYRDNQLVIYDEMIPCYTAKNSKTNNFYNLWTLYNPDINEFIKLYNKDNETYKDSAVMNPKENMPENNFPISALPMLSFTGFNLNLLKGYDYLLPIFTLGKYEYINNKYIMPLAMQVHHGVCDGYHVSMFIKSLQEVIDSI